jgi:hypothetical protein
LKNKDCLVFYQTLIKINQEIKINNNDMDQLCKVHIKNKIIKELAKIIHIVHKNSVNIKNSYINKKTNLKILN